MTTRVLIIGGGFGGLKAAFSLKNILSRPFEISLIDRSPCHSFVPSSHLIISGKVRPSQIQIPLDIVLAPAGIRFFQDEVHSVDSEKMQVMSASAVYPYDYLVLCPGAVNNFFDIPGAEAFSSRFRTPHDAERIRQKLLFRLAGDHNPCSIVVAGGGTEGVELMGEILDLIEAEGRKDEVKSGRVALILIEGKDRLLPSFPSSVQRLAQEYLEQRGVNLLAGDGIAAVTNEQVVLASGRVYKASMLIWSGGIQPSKLVRSLAFPKDDQGWIKVSDRLHLAGDETIYALGDAVTIHNEEGILRLQRLAPHAEDQARVAALNIHASIETEEQIPYVPKHKPQLISIGGKFGIFSADGKVYSGPWVVSLKKAIERQHLHSTLARPVSSALWSRVPKSSIMQHLRTRLPL
jgi:NADH dehydrogenase